MLRKFRISESSIVILVGSFFVLSGWSEVITVRFIEGLIFFYLDGFFRDRVILWDLTWFFLF